MTLRQDLTVQILGPCSTRGRTLRVGESREAGNLEKHALALGGVPGKRALRWRFACAGMFRGRPWERLVQGQDWVYVMQCPHSPRPNPGTGCSPGACTDQALGGSTTWGEPDLGEVTLLNQGRSRRSAAPSAQSAAAGIVTFILGTAAQCLIQTVSLDIFKRREAKKSGERGVVKEVYWTPSASYFGLCSRRESAHTYPPVACPGLGWMLASSSRKCCALRLQPFPAPPSTLVCPPPDAPWWDGRAAGGC